jgi:YD repeat-containing protein
MKKTAFILVYSLLSFAAIGQDNNFNRSAVTPVSPQAAQFMRYGEIPVDYSTGVPNISIPIYTAQSGNISLPISMSYNASGIKVEDVAGIIGLGWNLNAGGLISRSILGADDRDNKPKPYLSSTDVDNAINVCRNNGIQFSCMDNFVETVEDLFQLEKESQSDRYFYNFDGRSGIFRVNFQTGQPFTVPYSPLKISLGTNNAGPYKITDESGTTFYFEQVEATVSSNPGPVNATYYLTKIESADLVNTINIVYQTDQPVIQYIKNLHFSVTAQGTNVDRTLINNSFTSTTQPVMPAYITTENEKILFEYLDDRLDKRKSRLMRIKITNRFSNEVIKVIEFEHSYYGTANDNNLRLRLDNVKFKAPNSSAVAQYSFNYNATPLPPYYTSLVSGLHNVDYWGYYNAANDANLIPEDLFTSDFSAADKSTYGGQRNPVSWAAQACVLTDITYPTGGKTSFEYELNKVSNGYSYSTGGDDDYGGLRIKKITSSADQNALPLIKTYEYAQGMHVIIQPEMYIYNTKARYANGLAQPIPPDSYTTSICSDAFLPLTSGNSPVVYLQVTEYYGTPTANTGSIVYQYENNIPNYVLDPATLASPFFFGEYLIDKGMYTPQLLSKTFKKFNSSNNTFENARLEKFEYGLFHTGNIVTGVKVERDWPLIQGGDFASNTDCEVGAAYGWSTWAPFFANAYTYSNTEGVLDVPLVIKREEFEFDGSAFVKKVSHLNYDANTLQLIEEKVVDSKGDVLITTLKYPSDQSTVSPYITMVTQNVLSTIIEQSTSRLVGTTTNFLQSTKTHYDYWNGTAWSSTPTNIIVPKTIESKAAGQSAYELRVQYNSYNDKGRITSFAKKDDIEKVQVWGYNKSYLVAEVIGATHAQVAGVLNQTIINDMSTSDAAMRTELNKIRTYYPTARVSTYTYKPLVGMTSVTDINNRTIYYEYDAFNRLTVIRDQHNNVLKKICYNFSGHPEECQVFYNTIQSGSFTRNDCPSGYTGSTVTYTVPANTYGSTVSQAAANLLAQADINANGQAYANANGTCTVSTCNSTGNDKKCIN